MYGSQGLVAIFHLILPEVWVILQLTESFLSFPNSTEAAPDNHPNILAGHHDLGGTGSRPARGLSSHVT